MSDLSGSLHKTDQQGLGLLLSTPGCVWLYNLRNPWTGPCVMWALSSGWLSRIPAPELLG